MALGIVPSVMAAFKKSLSAFYEYWMLFLQFSFLAIAPLALFSVFLLGIYFVTRSQTLVISLGVLLATLSVIFIIPFYTCFMVVMVRVIFEDSGTKEAKSLPQ